MGQKAATSTSTQNTNQATNYRPDAGLMSQWGDVQGTASGQADYLRNNFVYQGNPVAAPTDTMSQYWQQAAGATQATPDVTGAQNAMTGIGGQMAGQMRDVSGINLPTNYNFAPSALQFTNPFASGTPNVSAAGGVSGNWQDYLVSPQQVSGPTVSAQNVTAPGAINPITGLMQVSAPQLQQYQMSQAQDVNAPQLRDLSMQAAANVSPSGQVTTQSWADPNAQQGLMSPYMQSVVDEQKRRATEDWQRGIEGQRSQAVAAGAYGGSRQAVEEATAQRDLQLQLGDIQSQGLQSAYQQAQQQFNTEQAARMQGQQFNVSTGLQAALANQQMQQQANLQNLSAGLQTQGLQAQTGLQAALANQQAGLTVGQQNLAALLGVQQLGSGQQMQAQQLNQATGLQAAIANQQAQEFGAGQQLQAGLANQQANLQAALASAGYNMQGQLANQAAGMQTGLAAQQMGLTGAQFNATQGLNAQLANQAAQMQAMGLQYQGGLQGALQTQNLGMQGQVQGAQMGLTAAQQQEALRQAQMGLNVGALGQQAGLAQQAANLGLNRYGLGLQGLAAQQQGAVSQQGYQQQAADQAYQNWLLSLMLPMQATSWQAGLLGQQPVPYTQTTTGTQAGTLTQPGPGIGSILGGVLGGVASILGRKGGRVPDDLEVARHQRGGRVHEDAAEDRRQVLDILREKHLLRRNGGLAGLAYA